MKASSPGVWGRRLSARIDTLRGGRRFDLTVSDGGTGFEEVFSGLSLVPAAVSGRPVSKTLCWSGPGCPFQPPFLLEFLDSAVVGNDGAQFGASAYTGPGMREAGRGIYALDRADLINLVVLPPYSATGVYPHGAQRGTGIRR